MSPQQMFTVCSTEQLLPHQDSGCVSLRLATLGQIGKIGAPLNPPLCIPGALPMPHQNDALGAGDNWQLQGRGILSITCTGT